MASNYTGNPTAVQAPATAPAVNNPIVLSIPAGTDVRTIESLTQALKVLADNGTLLLNILGATYTAKGLVIDGIGGAAAIAIGAGHIRITGGTPTVVTGTASGYLASGTGATATISGGGSDTRGILNVTTGTGPSGSGAALCKVTFGNPWTTAFPQLVLLTPANAAAAGLTATQLAQSSITQNDWTVQVGAAAGNVLAASTSYSWNYFVIG